MPPAAWYQQCDADLTRLARHVSLDALRRCYGDMLRTQRRTQFIHAVYEIHGAALLGERATRLELHVPRGDGSRRDYDVRAEIVGNIVHADSKTRTDEFPFNLPRQADPDGFTGYTGSRPTLDPFDADEFGLGGACPSGDATTKFRPESAQILDLLYAALTQLPDRGIRLVLLGHVQGNPIHLKHALKGVPVLDISTDFKTKEIVGAQWRLLPTGAFSPGKRGKAFRALSGVFWVQLSQWNGLLYRSYQLYVNPQAQEPITPELQAALQAVTAEWTHLPS